MDWGPWLAGKYTCNQAPAEVRGSCEAFRSTHTDGGVKEEAAAAAATEYILDGDGRVCVGDDRIYWADWPGGKNGCHTPSCTHWFTKCDPDDKRKRTDKSDWSDWATTNPPTAPTKVRVSNKPPDEVRVSAKPPPLSQKRNRPPENAAPQPGSFAGFRCAGDLVEAGSSMNNSGVCWGEDPQNPERKIARKMLNADDTDAEVQIMQTVRSRCKTSGAHRGCRNVIELLHDESQTGPDHKTHRVLYTPYYDQGNLQDWIWSRQSKLSAHRAGFAAQALAGLQALHSMRYVHCDMKSANVFITTGPDSQPVAIIGDLGTLTEIGQVQTSSKGTKMSFGDMRYMRATDMPATPVSEARDLFAWVLVVYEMAQGKIAPWVDRMPTLTAGVYDAEMKRDYGAVLQSMWNGQAHSLVVYADGKGATGVGAPFQ